MPPPRLDGSDSSLEEPNAWPQSIQPNTTSPMARRGFVQPEFAQCSLVRVAGIGRYRHPPAASIENYCHGAGFVGLGRLDGKFGDLVDQLIGVEDVGDSPL
jgi:hypothetical protein